MTTAPMTDVIIAGAGPVGLALACELGLRGVSCTVIEKRDGKLHVPKMSLVSAGSMEFCRRWGIAKQVRNAVWSEHHALDFVYMETLAGQELARIKIPSYAQGRPAWTPEGMCQCPQIFFDPILAARVGQLASVRVLYDTEMTGFADRGGHVDVDVRGLDGALQTLRARYLVGCDGASSLVREALGIALVGAGAIANSVNIFFRAPQLERLHDKGWARIYRPIDAGGCWSELIPIDGRELWRLTVFDDPRYASDPAAALRRMAGFDVPCEIISTLLWERRDAVAESYGRGRVLLAGDSAHVNNSIGGMGLNGGLQDGASVAEKLIEVLLNGASERQLDLYSLQRRTVTNEFVQAQTIANKKRLEARDPETRKRNFAELAESAADPVKAREFLLRTAMIALQRRAASISLEGV